jgi:TP901 family phage tail tape measure protein
MDRNLRIRMLLEAGDRATRPLRDIAGGSAKAARELKATRDRLRDLDRAQADINGFRELKAGLRSTEAQMGEAQSRVAALARQLAATDTPTKKLTAEFARAKRESAALKNEHVEQSSRLQQLRDRLGAAGVATGNLSSHERRLRGDISRTNEELAEQERRLRATADRAQRFDAAKGKFGKGMNVATGLAAGGYSSIQTGQTLAAPVLASSQGAMDLEEGMAGVAKVTGMAGDKLAAMREKLVTLSTKIPMTAIDLSQIAAAAGAAGVGMDKFGRPLPSQADDLVAFTDSAARMGIAFDMAANDAGGTMAKWRQAFQLPQAEVELLGDRINALTNKFGGKASSVADIVTRVGPLGKVAGLAAPAIAALGSTLDSIGVPSEIAATGIKNTMLALTKGSAATKSQVAAYKTLGLSATDVSKRMQIDANGTILDVFQRLKNLSPDKQASMLDQLFGSESIAAIAPLLTNLDGLQQRLGLVGDKSQFAGSMTNEFLSRINTTKGATDLAANGLQAVNLALGQALLPTIKSGAQWVQGIATRFRGWAKAHPTLAKALMFTTAVLSGLFVLLGGGAIVVAGLVAPFYALGAAAAFLNIGMLPLIGIVLAVVAAIALIAGGAYLIYAKWGAITAFFTNLWTSIKSAVSTGLTAIGGFIMNFSPVGHFIRIFSAVLAFLRGPLPGQMMEAGRNLIQGLIRGVMNMLGALKSTIVNAASSAAKWFKQKLGIQSPSRVFMGFGGYMMEGLDRGIASESQLPIRRLDRLSKDIGAAMAVGIAAPAIAATPVPAGAAGASARTTAANSGASGSGAGVGRASGEKIEINIYPAPGQSAKEIAEEVRRQLEDHRRKPGGGGSFADAPDWED